MWVHCPQVYCVYCEKSGHAKYVCPLRKRHMADKRRHRLNQIKARNEKIEEEHRRKAVRDE